MTQSKKYKTLELAQREMDIQKVLEKIRKIALEMKTIEDIGPVVVETRDALMALGMMPYRTHINLVDEDRDLLTVWGCKGSGKFSATLGSLSQLRNAGSQSHKPRPRGKRWQVFQWNKRQMASELRKRAAGFSQSDDQSKFDAWMTRELETAPMPFYQYRVFFSGGTIGLGMDRELDKEEIAIVRRVTETFDFAYKRFQELEQKEEQNRELTIQNALEKVRAQALGMQESGDIMGVATALRNGFEDLGYDLDQALIRIPDVSNKVMKQWIANPLISRDTAFREGREGSLDRRRAWVKKWEQNQKYWAEQVDRYWRASRIKASLTASGVSPADVRARIEAMPDSYYDNFLNFGDGLIVFGCAYAFSEEDFGIASRFADVFGMAYRRFRELQEKEEQNRELIIQNALERVRAQALGMQESHEIMAVAKLNYEEMAGLGYNIWLSGIVFYSEDGNYIDYYNTQAPDVQDGLMDTEFFHDVHKAEEVLEQLGRHRILQVSLGARDRGDHQFSYRLEGKELQAYMAETLERFFPQTDKAVALARIPKIITCHRFFIDDPSGPDDAIGALDFWVRGEPLDEAGIAVGRRFANAFEFAYSRFRELKEKEEQAREARRRAAVDRVRAEATAMQQSADVVQVLAGLWQGLQDAGLTFFACGIQFVNESANALTHYTIAETIDGMPEQKLFRKDVFDGVDIYTTNISLALARDRGYATPGVTPSVHTMADTFPQDLASYWDTGSTDIFAKFSEVDMLNIPIANGGTVIFAPADHRYTEQDLQIGKDFADAISLGFTRYFDFQRLEEQNRALEVANAEVREATRLKSQFLATMSHELRTPMNAIIGFTRLVLRRGTNLENRQRENLEKVQLSADHLLSLINDILDLSKVEAGRVDIMAASFDVAPVIENCCATVGPTLGKPGVTLVPDIQTDMGQVHTDEARLRQVIINLVSNALKFTESGEVRVTARLVKRDLEIVVSDTGIGIPKDQLETIFEEFRQVDNSSTRRHQGTGLGLAITKKLIELLGGIISVQSEEGKGSTFTLYIPSTYGEALQFREAPVISSRARLIVSIDDDPNVAVLLRQELEEDGYQVISALNADEGIALVKQHKPIAVTTDILMPGKDGWQTIAALKEDVETRDIPIIVVSAIENRSLGFSMGVHDYLVKPFDRDGLISALSRIKTE